MTFRTLWHQARLYPKLRTRISVRFWLLMFHLVLTDEDFADSFPHKITVVIK